MAQPTPHAQLSRRERQIMDVIWRRGRATVTEVLDQLPDPPSYSAVRAMLRILEEKGQLKHEADGPRYVYMPTIPRDAARKGALRHLLRTFFNGSTESAVAALLELKGDHLSDAELDRLQDRIEAARHTEEQP